MRFGWFIRIILTINRIITLNLGRAIKEGNLGVRDLLAVNDDT